MGSHGSCESEGIRPTRQFIKATAFKRVDMNGSDAQSVGHLGNGNAERLARLAEFTTDIRQTFTSRIVVRQLRIVLTDLFNHGKDQMKKKTAQHPF